MVIWVIGLAGSGKTTVGREVYKRWKAIDSATVLIDGDEIREIFRHDRGEAPYSVEGRRLNADRIAQMCAWLDRQNINVVCCILSIFEETRDWNRQTYGKYLEVYLDTSEKELAQRRHLYNEARAGKLRNVVGVDIEFIPPKRPDMVFDTGRTGMAADVIAEQIFANIQENYR